MNNFHDSFQKYSGKFERPLFYLGLGCIAMTTSIEYSKLKNENKKIKCLFLVDTFQWHLFASFIFPSIIISNSIQGFVLLLKKYIKNQKLLQVLCIGFSVCWIPAVVTPIDNLTNLMLDNSTRKLLKYI